MNARGECGRLPRVAMCPRRKDRVPIVFGDPTERTRGPAHAHVVNREHYRLSQRKHSDGAFEPSVARQSHSRCSDSWRKADSNLNVAYAPRHSSLTAPPRPSSFSSPERPRDRDTEKAVACAMDTLGYRDEVRCGCGYGTVRVRSANVLVVGIPLV